MILLFARSGNHYHMTRFKSDADIKRAFGSNGIDFERLVEECRDFTRTVPFFENKFGSTFMAGEGLTVAHVDMMGKETMNV